MKLLKTIKEKNAYPESQFQKEPTEYKSRKAARAVIFDNENKIALLHVSKHNYYKLPGGGIEDGEQMEDALKRECIEEAGCDVIVIGEIGRVVEYRDRYNLKQESFCYLAKLSGEKGEPNLQGYEIDDGFKVAWINANEALELVKNSKSDGI